MQKTIEDYRNFIFYLYENAKWHLACNKIPDYMKPFLEKIVEDSKKILLDSYEKPKKRKPIAICTSYSEKHDETLQTVICDDGAIFEFSNNIGNWGKLPDIPQDEE